MSYCTFDQFQGMWLGSIINVVLACHNHQGVSALAPDWLLSRNQLAELVSQGQQLESSQISEQVSKILPNTSLDSSEDNSWLTNVAVNQQQLKNLWEYQNTLLPLLPLIVFAQDNQDLLTAIITQCNLKATQTAEIKQDILIWSYLLNLVSNRQLDLQKLNVRLIVQQVLAGVKVETTSLSKNLEIVSQGWEQGITWQQLTEKLLARGNWGQIAIALAVYCFGSSIN